MSSEKKTSSTSTSTRPTSVKPKVASSSVKPTSTSSTSKIGSTKDGVVPRVSTLSVNSNNDNTSMLRTPRGSMSGGSGSVTTSTLRTPRVTQAVTPSLRTPRGNSSMPPPTISVSNTTNRISTKSTLVPPSTSNKSSIPTTRTPRASVSHASIPTKRPTSTRPRSQSVSKQAPEGHEEMAVEDDLDVIMEMQRQALEALTLQNDSNALTNSENKEHALTENNDNTNDDNVLTVIVDNVEMDEQAQFITNDMMTRSSAGEGVYGKRGLCERSMVDTGASDSVAQKMALFEDLKKKNAPEDWKTRIDELAAQNRALLHLKQQMVQKNNQLQQELEQELQLHGEKSKRQQVVEFSNDMREEEISKQKQLVLVKEQEVSDKFIECRLNEIIRKYLQAQLLSLKKNIRVYCRVRPFLDQEGVHASDTSTSVRQYGDFVSFPESLHPGLARKGAGLASMLQDFTVEQNERLKACEVELNTDSFGRDVNAEEVINREIPPYLKNNALRDKLVLTVPEKSVTGTVSKKQMPYRFDRVFNPYDTNEDVYADVDELVQSSVDGHAHVSVFMYGQTGSGKTHTMEGSRVKKVEDGSYTFDANTGILYRAIDTLFEKIKQFTIETNNTMKATVRMHVIEIYNEELFDLLGDLKSTKPIQVGDSNVLNRYHDLTTTTSTKVEVKQGKLGDYAVYMNEADHNQLDYHLSSQPVSIASPEEAYTLLSTGTKNRRVRSTQSNTRSSRSHLIVRVYIDSKDTTNGNIFKTSVNLVDLAGSERMQKSGVTGEGAMEAIEINKGLTALGDVLTALQSPEKRHIPYRNNQLTFLLQTCLEARNAKVVFLLHASPSSQQTSETVNTMRFGTKINTCTVPN